GIMVLAGPRLKVGLITNHEALRHVTQRLTTVLVEEKLRSFITTLRLLKKLSQYENHGSYDYDATRDGSAARGMNQSENASVLRIAVCGLNPHLSDGGLFGDEEKTILQPAISKWHNRVNDQMMLHVTLEPADTAFYKGYTGVYDGILACYHDQGRGPLKTVHFDTAINITGGLKHFRVSPDHGPARDLYHTGQASAVSLARCFLLCHHYLLKLCDSSYQDAIDSH
ncbi:MAG: 4-hydroxythreonine-4-phosphate dehydrogenase PdxA, partial [Proteobacteria bacterium]|nr:4-hydroxythreonine-4-phosphate dehydrogenase PdxA [Pseudomonadota bacterium]